MIKFYIINDDDPIYSQKFDKSRITIVKQQII